MKEQDITIRHHDRNLSGRVYWPEREKASLVIFSHGFNGSGEAFRAQAEVLAQNGIAAVTYDFCGGASGSKSDLSTCDMTIFTEKEDLFSVIDTVKTWEKADSDSVFLFGDSMGGLVSALAAEERAKEIRGMVLRYPALCVADNWNERFPRAEDIPETYELWGVTLGKHFFETLRGFAVFQEIGGYSGRVLILHGDQDAIVPLEYSERAKEIYRNARLEVFRGEGHGFSPAGNERVTEMLLEFVRAE